MWTINSTAKPKHITKLTTLMALIYNKNPPKISFKTHKTPTKLNVIRNTPTHTIIATIIS